MSAFWDDLDADLADPEFRREFDAETRRTETLDRLINDLADARRAAGLSEAELARRVGTDPDALRRLLTAGDGNPALGTLVDVAAALGLRVTLSR